ncbi:hypothetical protein DFH06DRAFT_1340921 [Mycena polygramma]|nr:hypothetical protein DFH06DRAFT_1340921 [Mycena polygramma]
MEIIKLYCGQWQDVRLTLPWPAFSQLNMASFPLLQRLTLIPSLGSHERQRASFIPVKNKAIIIEDAPLLRFAQAQLLSLDFARPLEQLTTLHYTSHISAARFIALLKWCPNLLDLSYAMDGTPDVSNLPHELPHLRTLTVDTHHRDVLSFFTVPRLERLEITAIHSIADATDTLVLRSACELHNSSSAPPTPSHLVFKLHASSVIKHHIHALYSDNILPRLRHLEMRDIGGTEHYRALLDLLKMRRTDAAFEICELFLGPNWPESGPTPVVPPNIMAEFRALAEAGLQLRLEAREAKIGDFAPAVYATMLDTRQ